MTSIKGTPLTPLPARLAGRARRESPPLACGGGFAHARRAEGPTRRSVRDADGLQLPSRRCDQARHDRPPLLQRQGRAGRVLRVRWRPPQAARRAAGRPGRRPDALRGRRGMVVRPPGPALRRGRDPARRHDRVRLLQRADDVLREPLRAQRPASHEARRPSRACASSTAGASATSDPSCASAPSGASCAASTLAFPRAVTVRQPPLPCEPARPLARRAARPARAHPCGVRRRRRGPRHPKPLPIVLATGQTRRCRASTASSPTSSPAGANVRSDARPGSGISRGVIWEWHAKSQTKRLRERATR